MLKVGVLSYEGENVAADDTELMKPYLRSMVQKKLTSVDVSNAAIWCVNELNKRCENIEWHMVVRNGYKVVTSFYYKFQDLMYPNNKIKPALSAFKNRKFHYPLDKTFWRPLPHGSAFYKKYEGNLRFAIICWYWTETLKQYEKNKESFVGFHRFEDIASGAELKRFSISLGMDFLPTSMLHFFEHPTNIKSSINYKLSDEQLKIFREICGDYMDKYYSDMDYYEVKY
tara:strand:- start:686 stop:1369 length:684 start_codon:yes stop_codon:yes gene_type:complete